MKQTLKRELKNNQIVRLTLRKYRRSRCIRISVHTDGEVTVTGPWRTSWKNLERYFWEHEAWVVQQWRQLATQSRVHFQVSSTVFQREKQRALKRVQDLLEEINQVYGFTWGRVTIRNQRTRWGSCSSQKNLSFHVRIAFLPEELARYLVVHELCHTVAMHHGKDFWDLVSRTCPEYLDLKKRLASCILEVE